MAVAIALSLVFEMELFLVKDYSAYRENKIIIPGGRYIYIFFSPVENTILYFQLTKVINSVAFISTFFILFFSLMK